MTNTGIRYRPILAWAALAVLLAAGAAQSAATFKEARPALPSDTRTAEQLFADAPDGVDPVVTGPVSAAFKQRQENAGCDSAVWPKIPTVCYPD
ncbi:MAG: hypothetical protein E5W72_11825 [Mesorhizobium sp.]|uniref:hypothetical protein n=1 Tax=Mesorhizobium sp. TaxID=1871066 RepID=UPI0011F49D4A|nr:hypothetical protein [Mesorhizobium sp.]TIS97092.1 MAG: hypothetical protein E5W87_28000 [Mesorhizobium sp.]TIT51219.1 MAG: hypothetical protein E5W72_11825 [Mesorhizobium sp.]